MCICCNELFTTLLNIAKMLLKWLLHLLQGCLVQVGNGIELDTVGLQFEPDLRLPCAVTWDAVPKQ